MPPKRRITYIDTEKKELLKFESNELRTISDFVALREIPTQSELNYLRSEYFHKAMILLESFLSNKDKIMNIIKAKELSSMWKWYYTWKRNETKDIEHRLIFFALRSRLDFLINIKNNINENDINTVANELEINDKKQDELKHFLKVGSIETLIIDSTVSSFWRMFNLITNKFYCLRYNSIFERHYERLYLCYGRLISLRLRKDPKRIFADPIYCTYDKVSGYRFTNKYFMETCEPIFNDIQRTFEIYKIMLNGTVHLNHDLGLSTNNNNNSASEIQYPVEKRKQFLSWLFEQIQGNFLEPSENEVQRYIYKLHLNPGEEERFRLEDRHSDPTPYNMISKYRRQHFDELADIFEKEQPLHDLVQRYMDIFNSLLPVVVPTVTVIVPEDKMELEEEGDKPTNNIFDNLYGEKSQHSQIFPEDIPATATTATTTPEEIKFQWKSEIDLIAMCLPMLTFAYAKNYPGALDFVETFVITQERIQSIIKRKISQKDKQYLDRKTIQQIVLREIYNFRIISNTQEVPIFVQLFNEMFILEDGFILPGSNNNGDYVLPRFTRCTDFISCYLHWMKLCCENQKINGLPCKSTVESLNLTDQYTLFFPENKEVISRLNSLHNKKQHEIQTNLGLPDNYNKQ